ncbi:hypothetical protein TNCT_330871 [Trichonephila clavata]|uniref:Uncharacterized protein n=1 Tax=Trichonephila clavata TaxID=2740835 RepID=A0A8X6G0I7_TRICU|nr:hypothetical protein TNCT_330871 [Trichonephila clavata]
MYDWPLVGLPEGLFLYGRIASAHASAYDSSEATMGIMRLDDVANLRAHRFGLGFWVKGTARLTSLTL